MKLILAANTMEHPGFAAFVRDAMARYPDAALVIGGDLLNVFPEPGEDLQGSILYQIYGQMIDDELGKLRLNHFTDVEHSPLVGPLREVFQLDGRNYTEALAIASRRYARVFSSLREALGSRIVYFIPGNMDYPEVSALFSNACPGAFQLDGDMITVDGVRLAGIGGIPHSAQPFGHVTAISPYEMTDEDFERRLASVWGADVLISHLSPDESPALESFVRESPLRLLICRSPFSLREYGNCRGLSQCDYIEGKPVIKVRPFEYPENLAFIVDFFADPMADPIVDLYAWRASAGDEADLNADLTQRDDNAALPNAPAVV
jgi:Icc-related predicted phosphoesterase